MSAPIVFFDIAGLAENNLKGFYSELLGWQVAEDGEVTTQTLSPANTPSLMGNLRTDPAETLLYFGVDDVTETLRRVVELGGEISQPRFEVPGTVVLGLFVDPAGNRQGLIELENGDVKVP